MAPVAWESLGDAAGVLSLAVAVVGLLSSVSVAEELPLRSVVVEWVGDFRSPFLMAASIFMSQSLVSCCIFFIMGSMQELSDCWGARFQRALPVYAFMSLLGAFMYLTKFASHKHLVLEVPGIGQHLITRNLHWLVSTPMQWYIFGQTCCRATRSQMTEIIKATTLMQVHGILMLCIVDSRYRWFCFWASCGFFVRMFWLVFHLPLLKDMEAVAKRIRWSTLVVWACFPFAVLARWFNIIDPWWEQVVIFSILDIWAKAITFSAILVSRVVLCLAHINGTVQLVMSSHDMTVAVNEDFQLVESPVPPMISSFFGLTSEGDICEDRKLSDLCINEEHQLRLLEAARVADRQHLGAPTPKVLVAFRSARGRGDLLYPECLVAECLVSKCLHGRRIIGIALASQSGLNGGWPLELQRLRQDSEGWDALSGACTQNTDISFSSRSMAHPRNTQMQMMLALHNCSYTLQFDFHLQKMLTKLFLHSENACSIFVWDESPDAGVPHTVVVASPRFQAIYCPSSFMPQPLSHFIDEVCIDTITLAHKREEVALHQWRHTQSLDGAQVTLTTLPLNRLSPLAAGSDVKLSILMLEASKTGDVPSESLQGYFSWLALGGELVLDRQNWSKDPHHFGGSAALALSVGLPKPPEQLVPLATAETAACNGLL